MGAMTASGLEQVTLAWLEVLDYGASAAIAGLRHELASRGEAEALFGQERGESLNGILGAAEQTFDDVPPQEYFAS